MSSTVKAAPIALVLCDAIYQDPVGGKTTLVGLFNNIAATKFPIAHPRLAVFASVTGLREGSHAKLEIIHGETEQPIVSASGPFPKETMPLTVADLNFVFNNVVFPEEGIRACACYEAGPRTSLSSRECRSPSKGGACGSFRLA